ncbi:MAG: tol-pal system-associated acyl-CoA thioesterase [Shimia sp.]|uniref:tol-pal system-associated acyl-CoA thioesterase n=1 Tax=Shimia sp. TaxID=1954381 RepID=UPI001B08ADC6|nr:tol-pal system-associated acyl-CoA thioesterase [Shimia sp.]MBO6897923.1 tol-pal system-associated acyl-CoA thioesterase [Shimia sp.]
MPYTLPIRVYYEDTDMAGIVYYANYLKFIERGRSEWVREIGMDQLEMKAEGVVFAVRRVECDYLGSAVLDDLLTVETEVANVTAARLVMEQRVKRGDEVLFHAMVTVVCMNEAGQPVRLPANIRQMVH